MDECNAIGVVMVARSRVSGGITQYVTKKMVVGNLSIYYISSNKKGADM